MFLSYLSQTILGCKRREKKLKKNNYQQVLLIILFLKTISKLVLENCFTKQKEKKNKNISKHTFIFLPKIYATMSYM